MSIIIGERWHIPVYSFFLQEKKTSRRKRFFSLSCRFSNSSPATAKYSKKNKKDVHCFIFSTCFTENYSCVLLYYFYMTRQTFFIHPFKKIIQKACSILKIIITDPPFKKSILLLYIATDAASSATAITIMDVERWFISRKIKNGWTWHEREKLDAGSLLKMCIVQILQEKGKERGVKFFYTVSIQRSSSSEVHFLSKSHFLRYVINVTCVMHYFSLNSWYYNMHNTAR